MRRLPFFFSLLLLAASVTPQPALAQTAAQKRQAKKHFEEAKGYFNVGKFREAIAEFQKSYLLFKAPEILFMIGQCHNQLGEYRMAIHFYRTFLAERPNAKNREDIEAMIADLEARIAREHASPSQREGAPPGHTPKAEDGSHAGARASGERQAPPPRPAERRAAPVAHAPKAAERHHAPAAPKPSRSSGAAAAPADGRPASGGTERHGGTPDLALRSPETPPPVPPVATAVSRSERDERRPFYRTWWFWTGTAAVVATVVVTAVVVSTHRGGAPTGSTGTIDCTDPGKGCVVLGVLPSWGAHAQR